MATVHKRPLSPHAMIYQPQYTWIPSITHRLSQIINFFAGFAGLWAILAVMAGPEAYNFFVDIATSPVGRVAMIGWTFTFFYMMAHDVRHLFWNFIIGFELKTVQITAWTIVAFSVVATAAVWLYVLV